MKKIICFLSLLILLTSCSDENIVGNTTPTPINDVVDNVLPTIEPTISTTILPTITVEITPDPNILTYDNFGLDDVVEYKDTPFIEINNGIPFFKEEDIINEAYESYSGFDDLGRVQKAMACIGPELMPYDERESISHVDIEGMKQAKYDNVDGKYLYNRSHLIGFQLTGENDNIYNLMTGTRYFNVEGMLSFENIVANYVTDTFNHVMYRVTPYFSEDDLVAKGVLMEAYSVEDQGLGVNFNVFVYNVQPGIKINYKTGESTQTDNIKQDNIIVKDTKEQTYYLNTNSHKFHHKSCRHAKSIKDKNLKIITGIREDIINMDYDPCKVCNP